MLSCTSQLRAEQIQQGAASDAMYRAISFCCEHVKIICFQCYVCWLTRAFVDLHNF